VLARKAILVWELGGTLEYWNAEAVILYGYSREEAVARVSHELLKTTFPQDMESLLSRLERQRHWRGELSHRTKDGRILTVEARLQVLDQNGRRTDLQDQRPEPLRFGLRRPVKEIPQGLKHLMGCRTITLE